MRSDIWTKERRGTPLWLDEVPPLELVAPPLPASCDVAIVGAGYTGLNAALELARGGREVVVLEAGDPGHGCSTRNGGQVSASLHVPLGALTRRLGRERAVALHREGENALDWVEALVRREGIDCDFVRSGHFHAAHTPRHFERLARGTDEDIEETFVVPPEAQHHELGTAIRHGGLVYPRHASLHPARYHRALLARAVEAGVSVVPHCRASAIGPDRRGVVLSTSGGRMHAAQAIVASNGYTDTLVPWLRRRIVPIGSQVVATEPLPESLVDELLPTNRTVTDTRKVVYYYRASPDRRRIVFGGRVSVHDCGPEVGGPRLHAELCRLFPALRGTRLSHAWSGSVAFSFDELPHVGSHDGVHHALGYCGSGIAMASYLGAKLGRRLLDPDAGRTAFDGLPFPTRPLYTGRPWFLPAVIAWYRWRDRVG